MILQCKWLLCFVFVSDVFKSDDNFLENEEKYKQLKKGSIFCKLYHYVFIVDCDMVFLLHMLP